jgi:cation-transporting ATPase 13A3/4/5
LDSSECQRQISSPSPATRPPPVRPRRCAQAYYSYSLIILAITLFSIVANVVSAHQYRRRLAALAHYACEVQVLSGGRVASVDSRDLLPGDVVVLHPGVLPCDVALVRWGSGGGGGGAQGQVGTPTLGRPQRRLSCCQCWGTAWGLCGCFQPSARPAACRGEAIVDENMLTGEAVPVRKVAYSPAVDGPHYDPDVHKGCTLYSGTCVAQVGGVGGGGGRWLRCCCATAGA